MTHAILKARKYVADPSDAPEGVKVEHGSRGGYYYETGTFGAGHYYDYTTRPKSLPTVESSEGAIKAQFNSDYYANLSRGQRVSLERYMGGTTMNDDIRRGVRLSGFTQDMDSAMRPMAQPVTVYRGLDTKFLASIAGSDPGDLEALVGVEFRDNGYVSTSFDLRDAYRYANGNENPVIMRLDIPKGAPAVYCDPIIGEGWADSDSAEHELLLARGATYKITGFDYSGELTVLTVSLAKKGKGAPREQVSS